MGNDNEEDLLVDAADFRENQAHYFGQVHHADKLAVVMKYRKPFVVVSSEKKYRRNQYLYEALAELADRFNLPLEFLDEASSKDDARDLVLALVERACAEKQG